MSVLILVVGPMHSLKKLAGLQIVFLFFLKWSAKRVVDMFKDFENTTNSNSMCVSVSCVELNCYSLFYFLIDLV